MEGLKANYVLLLIWRQQYRSPSFDVIEMVIGHSTITLLNFVLADISSGRISNQWKTLCWVLKKCNEANGEHRRGEGLEKKQQTISVYCKKHVIKSSRLGEHISFSSLHYANVVGCPSPKVFFLLWNQCRCQQDNVGAMFASGVEQSFMSTWWWCTNWY